MGLPLLLRVDLHQNEATLQESFVILCCCQNSHAGSGVRWKCGDLEKTFSQVSSGGFTASSHQHLHKLIKPYNKPYKPYVMNPVANSFPVVTALEVAPLQRQTSRIPCFLEAFQDVPGLSAVSSGSRLGSTEQWLQSYGPVSGAVLYMSPKC